MSGVLEGSSARQWDEQVLSRGWFVERVGSGTTVHYCPACIFPLALILSIAMASEQDA